MYRRTQTSSLGLLLAVLLLTPAVEAQTVDPVRYAIVKAGYVLNLLRLTQWPDNAFSSEEDPLVVRVIGEDAMTAYLEELVDDELIGNRPVVVERLSLTGRDRNAVALDAEQVADALRDAHLVFVARDALAHLETILIAVAPFPVLTVSDIPGFAAHNGGMVGLAVREDTVGLEANVQRLEQSGVSLSARVLQLASIVSE